MHLYIHAKGQLIRNLDKPIISLARDSDSFNGTHTVSVKRVDVLRRRPHANIPCKEYAANEDEQYFTTVIEELECVPVYWKFLNLSTLSVRIRPTKSNSNRSLNCFMTAILISFRFFLIYGIF